MHVTEELRRCFRIVHRWL